MGIGAAVSTAIKGTVQSADAASPFAKSLDELNALSAQVAKEPTDAQVINQTWERIRAKSTLNRDGSLRSGTETKGPGVTYLNELKSQGDIRGIRDAVERIDGFEFTKDGSGAGGTGTLVEALTKPGWQHSGRQVKIVNMSPTEYLARSAKGHGMSYDELRAQLAQGDRTDNILKGIAQGESFAMPYLDFRGGSFGQEGQHRAMAAAMLGKEKIPVAVMWDDVKKPVAAKAENQRLMEDEGFDTDTTYLHGTIVGDPNWGAALTQKQMEEMTGFRGDRGVAGHFTLDPKFADIFSGSVTTRKNPVNMPVHLRKDLAENTFDQRNMEHRDRMWAALDKRVASLRDGTAKGPEGHPYGENFANVLADNLEGLKDDLLVADFGFKELEQFKPQIEEAGFKAYLDFERRGEGPTGIAVFDTNDVKSVFAPGKREGTFGGALAAAVGLSQGNEAEAGTPGTPKSSMADTASQAAPLLDQIGKIEANSRYDIEFGGGTVDLPNMTIQEVLDHQAKRKKEGAKSTAVGKYQFINKTLAELVKRNPKDFPKDRLFDKAAQDELAAILLKRRGLDKYKAGKITKEEFAKNLSKEWASLPNPETGKSYYDGDGLNHSLMKADDLIKIIEGL